MQYIGCKHCANAEHHCHSSLETRGAAFESSDVSLCVSESSTFLSQSLCV